jgi:hypothetical protein
LGAADTAVHAHHYQAVRLDCKRHSKLLPDLLGPAAGGELLA